MLDGSALVYRTVIVIDAFPFRPRRAVRTLNALSPSWALCDVVEQIVDQFDQGH